MTVHACTTKAPETFDRYTICSRGICLIQLTHWTFKLILIHEVERSSPIGDQLIMTLFRPVCYCRCILLEWNCVLNAKQGAFLIHDVIYHQDIMLPIKTFCCPSHLYNGNLFTRKYDIHIQIEARGWFFLSFQVSSTWRMWTNTTTDDELNIPSRVRDCLRVSYEYQ